MTSLPQMRSAALLLHSLSPIDQEMILSDLGSSDQQSLRALLTELRDLGISGDSRFIKQVLASEQIKLNVTPSMVGSHEFIARLDGEHGTEFDIEQLTDQYGREQLSRELSSEPTIVVAALIYGSATAEKLLQYLSPLASKRIRAQLSTWREHQGVPPALRKAALHSLVLKLQNLVSPALPKHASNRSSQELANLSFYWNALIQRWKNSFAKQFLSERRR